MFCEKFSQVRIVFSTFSSPGYFQTLISSKFCLDRHPFQCMVSNCKDFVHQQHCRLEHACKWVEVNGDWRKWRNINFFTCVCCFLHPLPWQIISMHEQGYEQ